MTLAEKKEGLCVLKRKERRDSRVAKRSAIRECQNHATPSNNILLLNWRPFKNTLHFLSQDFRFIMIWECSLNDNIFKTKALLLVLFCSLTLTWHDSKLMLFLSRDRVQRVQKRHLNVFLKLVSLAMAPGTD